MDTKDNSHKGCLLLLAVVAIYAAGLAVGLWMDWPWLKFACYLLPGLAGAYVGSIYFAPEEKRYKNRFSRRTWTLLVIGYLALVALLAWVCEGRLW